MATQPISNLVTTWNAAGTTFTAIKMNVTDTASAAASRLMDLQVGGSSRFSVSKLGRVDFANAMVGGTNSAYYARNDSAIYALGSSDDVVLNRDAANTLAQRNGTNAQAFRLYNTYTDASNYERADLGWSSNEFFVGTGKAGTGSGRALVLRTNGSSRFFLQATDGHLLASTDNTYDIGASGANRPRNLYVAGRANIDGLTVGKGGQTAVADNTAFGVQALNSASLTGVQNVAIGNRAGELLTTGGNSVFVGHCAGQALTTGGNNVGVGRFALASATTAAANTAVGQNAMLYFNTDNNTAVGFQALQGSSTVANNTGNNLTSVGYRSLYSNTTGGSNSAVGNSALYSNTTGSNNTGLGDEAGDVITTGARNTIVGANSDPSANNGNDQTVVGEGLTGKGDDTAFIGGTNGAYNEKNVTTWETTSDVRIKKDIADFAGGLNVIEQVRVRSFQYRTPDEITDLPQSAAINQPGVQLGVIAQELQSVLPECVTENSTGVLSVSTDPLVWYLINAVKQLSAEVKALKGL